MIVTHHHILVRKYFIILGKEARYDSAFIALRSGPIEAKLSSFERILFTHTDVNPGGHYNLTTGQYTCPVDGIYFFSLMLSSETRANGIIVAGGTRIEIALSRNEFGPLTTIYGSIIYYCKAGAKVSPAARHDCTLSGWPQMNIFGGFLIAEV